MNLRTNRLGFDLKNVWQKFRRYCCLRWGILDGLITLALIPSFNYVYSTCGYYTVYWLEIAMSPIIQIICHKQKWKYWDLKSSWRKFSKDPMKKQQETMKLYNKGCESYGRLYTDRCKHLYFMLYSILSFGTSLRQKDFFCRWFIFIWPYLSCMFLHPYSLFLFWPQ
jgi:YidC/Oxa1 family membrane protein insertase